MPAKKLEMGAASQTAFPPARLGAPVEMGPNVPRFSNRWLLVSGAACTVTSDASSRMPEREEPNMVTGGQMRLGDLDIAG